MIVSLVDIDVNPIKHVGDVWPSVDVQNAYRMSCTKHGARASTLAFVASMWMHRGYQGMVMLGRASKDWRRSRCSNCRTDRSIRHGEQSSDHSKC